MFLRAGLVYSLFQLRSPYHKSGIVLRIDTLEVSFISTHCDDKNNITLSSIACDFVRTQQLCSKGYTCWFLRPKRISMKYMQPYNYNAKCTSACRIGLRGCACLDSNNSILLCSSDVAFPQSISVDFSAGTDYSNASMGPIICVKYYRF